MSKEKLKELINKLKKPNKNSLQEAMEKTRQNILGQGSVETWKNIAEANNGDSESVEERVQNEVNRRTTDVESYDNNTDSKEESPKNPEKEDGAKTSQKERKEGDYAFNLKNGVANDDDIKQASEDYVAGKYNGGGSKTKKEIKKWLKNNGYEEKNGKWTKSESVNENKNEKTSEIPATTATTETTDSETADVTSREVKDNLQRNQFAQYRNSLHPSTIGAIISKNSGLSASERVSMALKAIGKLTGNAFLANGMSLLGDNSYFSKIGEGLDLDSMTSDEQKKVSDELANQIASEAVDVQANKTVIERELADMPQAKKDYLSASAHALISLSPENFKAQLKGIKIKDPKTKEVITFTDDEINNIIKIKPMLQNNSKTTRANQSDIVDTKAKQRDFNFGNFKNEADKTKAIQELEEYKQNLIKAKADITQSNGIDKQIEAFQKYASAYGGIGSSSYTSSQSQNSAKQSSSQWTVSGSVKLPIADIGVSGGGGHSWGENTAFGTNDGKSFTFNENYKFGGEQGKRAFEKWWSENGSSIQSELLNSIDERIKDLDNDISSLNSMSVVDDALIPNGEIETITLKDGSTVVPNENDGAVLTTNPVSDSFLTFGEGEENPFDYLGYEGKKLTQEEAERIFDKEPLSDYESIMAYLES